MNNCPKALAYTVAALLLGDANTFPVLAQSFSPGNLVVSRSVYAGTASTVTVGQSLPPNCPATASCPTKTAVSNGEFPNLGDASNVWNNDSIDGSFGVTSPIFLDQLTTGGALISSLAVPPAQIVTSFSSKSELALNLSTDSTVLTFMGYLAGAANVLDVSNSNTHGVFDPTNPVGGTVDRGVAKVDPKGVISTTSTYAYSGNNGRAAILSGGLYYTAGNDNNGNQPTTTPFTSVLQQLIAATGVQIVDPNGVTGNYTQVGTFSVTQYGFAADKPGKDTNFRGLTIFNNTLYTSKGSGSNGINTVYQVGTAGTLPAPATAPVTMTILPGFPTALAKTAGINDDYPFGIWFANANTLYVGDEGDGAVADAGISTHAGLQKWILSNGIWTKAYVLQKGLNLGQQYSVTNYPMSLNPATAGLRNLTGRVNGDGTATIWGVTSTVSANGDQGADPNKLMVITDVLANTDPAVAAGEQFTALKSAGYGEVLRGVSFTPAAPLGTITLWANTIVSLGQSGTLPVLLSAPAPDGGVTVTLTSSDPTKVAVTPNVFIPAGRMSANLQPKVTGIGIGAATISASAMYYGSTSQQVVVTGSLGFGRTVSILAPATQNATLSLSGPTAGSLTVNLSSDDTGVATVPSSVAFAPGASSVTVPITGVAGGSTIVRASVPLLPMLTGATVGVSVISTGTILWPPNAIVAAGSSLTLPIALSAPAPEGGVTITLSSSTLKATVTPTKVVIAGGATTPATQPQVNGVSTGAAFINASAPGFGEASVYLTVQ